MNIFNQFLIVYLAIRLLKQRQDKKYIIYDLLNRTIVSVECEEMISDIVEMKV